ncbi:MAG: Txe/YoeB family addiction module toxin [Prevotellaceae bacterium]|nr:Txe/YoeB family addiction module toxin [Prevotellaceae bacterium]
MYSIDFDQKVQKVMAKWKKSNPTLFKKLGKILIAIQEDPRHGIGHPEPLVGGGGITYSRHITAHHRIIYDIYEAEIHVLIIELEGHYGDK